MADEDNKPQDQTPPFGMQEPGGGPQKSGGSPELEAEATKAANAAPEGQKDEAAAAKVDEKIAEARAGVAELGEAGAAGDKGKPAVAKTPEETGAQPPAEKPKPAPKPAGDKPEGEKPAAAKAPAAKAPAKPAGEGAAKPAGAAEPKKPAARAVATMPTAEIKDDALIDAVKARFGAAIIDALEVNGQQVMRVAKEQVHDILAYLRHDATPAFDMLTDLTCVHVEKDKQFEIVYQIYSVSNTRRLRVKTAIADGEPIATACDIWSTANWLEREVYDLFGVRFTNHPDLRRILLPQGWVGHPLRKEHPLEYQDNEWVAQNLKIRDLPEDWDYTGKFE